MRIFTHTLSSGSITIRNSDYVTQLSIQANDSSSCTILGSGTSFQSLSPNAITLENGENMTLTAPDNAPLDGITITWVSGTIDILIGK